MLYAFIDFCLTAIATLCTKIGAIQIWWKNDTCTVQRGNRQSWELLPIETKFILTVCYYCLTKSCDRVSLAFLAHCKINVINTKIAPLIDTRHKVDSRSNSIFFLGFLKFLEASFASRSPRREYLEGRWTQPRILCNGNGAISHLQTEMGFFKAFRYSLYNW